ncbi:MAG: hypothetical protein JO353_00375, partial [Phycisphaerae bacterium]|nr:hypothetical protein [Phycisphaerae bacterium]
MNFARFIRGRILLVATSVLLIPSALAAKSPSSAPTGPVTPQMVDDSLEKAKRYLFKQMKDTSWESVPQPAGSATDVNGGQW